MFQKLFLIFFFDSLRFLGDFPVGFKKYFLRFPKNLQTFLSKIPYVLLIHKILSNFSLIPLFSIFFYGFQKFLFNVILIFFPTSVKFFCNFPEAFWTLPYNFTLFKKISKLFQNFNLKFSHNFFWKRSRTFLQQLFFWNIFEIFVTLVVLKYSHEILLPFPSSFHKTFYKCFANFSIKKKFFHFFKIFLLFLIP